MNTTTLKSGTAGSAAAAAKRAKEFSHNVRVAIAAAAAFVLVAVIAGYGANYYILPLGERPYSDKYELLKPGGAIGLKLGIFGTFLFFIIFLYAFRKIIPWLGRYGTAKHWMDFHVICGITAPILIAFHASFKFRGIAGVAFWIMVLVAISGFIGRYLYAQIPRSLTAAELSLTDLRQSEQELSDALLGQAFYSSEQLSRALHVPSPEHIKHIGALRAVGEMIVLDFELPFRVAGLRRASSGFGTKLLTMGGLLSSGRTEIEHIVRLVRQKRSLAKKVVFLGQSQKLLHLWHVIHRPFSYAFAVLAILHIVVVLGLGFGSMGFR
jgi:hypothetical protein